MNRILCYLLVCCCLPCWAQAQLFEIQSDGRWGFMDRLGQVVVPPQYDFMYPAIPDSATSGLFLIQQADHLGLYQQGKGEILAPIYHALSLVEAHGEYVIRYQENGWVGMRRIDTSQVFPAQYQDLLPLQDRFFGMKQQNYWGLIQAGKAPVILPRFFSIEQFKAGLLVGAVEQGFEVWDTLGQQHLSGLASLPRIMGSDLLMIPGEQDQQRLIRLDSSEVLPLGNWSLAESGDYLLVEDNSLYGLLHEDGRMIADLRYRQIVPEEHDLFWMQEDRLWGLMDSSGSWRIEPTFTRRGLFEGAVGKVVVEGKTALINQFGDFLSDLDCDRIEIYPGVARILKDDIWTQIAYDKQGRFVPRKRLLIRQQQTKTDTSQIAILSDSIASKFWESDPRQVGWERRIVDAMSMLQPEDTIRWVWTDSVGDSLRYGPTFHEVYPVPQYEISVVGRTRRSIDPETGGTLFQNRLGLFDHRLGKLIQPLRFGMIYIQDFEDLPVARAQFPGGAFVLLSRKGSVRKTEFTRYIGPFQAGIARACRRGYLFAPIPKAVGEEPRFDPRSLPGTWTYLHWSGKWSETPDYDFAENYAAGLGLFELNGKWGALNEKFVPVIKPTFDQLFFPETGTEPTDSLLPLLCGEIQSSRFFLLNQQGLLQRVINADELRPQSEGMMAFAIHGKWGYLDSLGQEMIAPTFDQVKDFQEGLAPAKKGRYWGFINRKGEWAISARFSQVELFSQGVARVRAKRRYGYVLPNGDMLIGLQLMDATNFRQGVAIARYPQKLFGLLQTNGKWALPPKYQEIRWVGEYLQVTTEKGLVGFCDSKGTFLLSPKYDLVRKFVNGVAVYRINMNRGKKGGPDYRFGYLSRDMKEITPATFLQARSFQYHLGAAYKQVGDFKFWGAIDANGQTIIPFENIDVRLLEYGVAEVDKVDVNGTAWRKVDVREAMPPRPIRQAALSAQAQILQVIEDRYGYTDVQVQADGSFLAKTDQKVGILTHAGNWRYEPEYESITFREGLYKLTRGNDIGYLDRAGNWVWHPDTGGALPAEAKRGE
ncbi:MAG: WG repeat-containing protein [Bacteroidota bacterium]